MLKLEDFRKESIQVDSIGKIKGGLVWTHACGYRNDYAVDDGNGRWTLRTKKSNGTYS